ncbi:phosphatidylinositol-specific phospholipase C1-like protein [Acetobacter sacchari]|uniref:Phosphatidylinositol-specific phospholipase C1-like protein n=1 Tax=Acetobacter sacchari TaxID=2661687 RepID=A0ABS3LXN6_9PROT|nr:phosphatidylinositol-specific phospholipase C1-like protein [Acetobacter sacchari]MBO1360682.1 phosphatidylinositol-specific phospholipase C1-like protein [Acetobacter sacchari]
MFRSKRLSLPLLALLVLTPTYSVRAQGVDGSVRLNQIQIIGTHNSYRSDISPVTLKWLQTLSPKMADALDYRHTSLQEQFDSGVRQIEIDIYADTRGGEYSHPKGPAWERQSGLQPAPESEPSSAMQGDDFKVMHIVDVDQRSNCEPLRKCLEIVSSWSKAHPGHLPLFVDLETKQDIPFKSEKFPFTTPETFTPATYDKLDKEILQTVGRANILTPDDVRGHFDTLDQAVRTTGWPTLSLARGKIVFLFDRPHDTARYTQGHPALRGRVVFTNSRPGDPDGAFTEVNEGFVGQAGNGSAAVNNAAAEKSISELVKAGYLVRTRADANTVEPRAGDTSRRDVAFHSGAQIISTDFPALEPARWNNYVVAFPDDLIARCDPLNAPKDCQSASLEKRDAAATR